MTLTSPTWPRARPLSIRGLALAALAVLGSLSTALEPRTAHAQSMPPYVPIAPAARWESVETAHFVFHFPAELATWTRDVASRIEAERRAVGQLVGYAPVGRVTVLVADPYNDANGSAYPFLRGPTLFLWPVPAGPRAGDGASPHWADVLAVHEFAHLAHLTRPSREPRRGRLAALLPTNIGPIGASTPRWVWEGYATYVEGRVTGSGRPHGAWRPAFLREWAIEGRLPSYAQISGTAGFAGGSFAYLAGSAYFEWLVAQRGDSSLPAVWRRLTARTPRSFDAAFAGVFAGSPAELYARWSAEVTAEAIAAERALTAAGAADGSLVQRLRGATGDPAVSSDGRRVALVVRSPGRLSRIVIWNTGAAPRDTAVRRAARPARPRPRDPEDVVAISYLPAPKRAIASLVAHDGRPFGNPRWLPDGRRLLVERDEPLADGRTRPDLWTWNSVDGALRRVTRGAAVRDADPSPDGMSAIATRCTAGWCDVVRVDLATGAVAMLVAGSPLRTYAHPRSSPDGRHFAVAVQADEVWRVQIGALGSGAAATLRDVGPSDRVSRYDPAYLRDGSGLLVTSERGGVPNVERLGLGDTAAIQLTRVTGAAFAPEPIDAGSAYFLALRSTGFDLRRVRLDSAVVEVASASLVGRGGADEPSATGPARLAARVAVGPAAAAAAEAVAQRVASVGADSIAASEPASSRRYGLGPPRYTVLPSGAWTADGNSVAGWLASADPVGRLTWVLVGAAGAPASWRGGSLSGAYRGIGPTFEAQAFGIRQRTAATGGVVYHGAVLAAAPRRTFGSGGVSGRLGGSAGRLVTDGGPTAARTIGFAEARASATRGRGDLLASASIGGSVVTGVYRDSAFARWQGSAALAVRAPLLAMRASYLRGATSARAPGFERHVVGGAEPALADAAVLGQRVSMPALATGAIAGRGVETARVALGGSLLEPFVWAGRAPDRSARWLRVVGAEASFVTGPIPFARAPGVRAVAGAGYALDGPTRHHAQGYFSVVVRP